MKDKEGNFIYNKKGNIKTRKFDLVGWDNKELVEDWRKEWSNYTNKMLEREGVNERIDHRSHEERVLEFQPTQHLGYKVIAMEKSSAEKDGIQTDRGNYNREVKDYNQTIVDLQTYREEKQEAEQEKTRQEEQKAKAEQFSIPAERTHLQSAEKFLKAEPTFDTIDKRLQQLSRFEAKNDNDYQVLEQTDQDFKAIKHHLWEISFSHNQIKENQIKVDNTTSLFKGISKENRKIKESTASEIERRKSITQEYERKLEPYREKHKFHSESEFNTINQDYQNERLALREQNGNKRGAIRRERDVLQKAKTALENRFSFEKWLPSILTVLKWLNELIL